MPFALGCATGLLLFVRLLSWLLKRWHGQTVALLMGFMAGSLWSLAFPHRAGEHHQCQGQADRPAGCPGGAPSVSALAVSLLLMGLGVLLVLGLERLQQRMGAAEMGG